MRRVRRIERAGRARKAGRTRRRKYIALNRKTLGGLICAILTIQLLFAPLVDWSDIKLWVHADEEAEFGHNRDDGLSEDAEAREAGSHGDGNEANEQPGAEVTFDFDGPLYINPEEYEQVIDDIEKQALFLAGVTAADEFGGIISDVRVYDFGGFDIAAELGSEFIITYAAAHPETHKVFMSPRVAILAEIGMPEPGIVQMNIAQMNDVYADIWVNSSTTLNNAIIGAANDTLRVIGISNSFIIGSGTTAISIPTRKYIKLVSNGEVELTVNGNRRHFIFADNISGRSSSLTIAGNVTLSRANDYIGDGGGVTLANAGATLNLEGGGKISNNRINGGHGGGVLISGSSTFNMTGGEISGNTAAGATGNNANGSGGGVAVNHTGATFHFSGGTISGNNADGQGNTGGGYGGGAAVLNGSFNMSGSGRIIENSARRLGGGIYTVLPLIIAGGEIIGNGTGNDGSVRTENGGGVYTTNTLEISGGAKIINNAAAQNGGGIYANGFLEISDRVEISGNVVAQNGGGVWTNGTLEIANSTISDNRAASNGGGVWTSSMTEITDSTVSGNKASVDGGGIFTTNLRNLTLASNVAFSGNAAGIAYWLDMQMIGSYDPGGAGSSISVDELKTLNPDQNASLLFSHPPENNSAFRYVYNNYDINFVGTVTSKSISWYSDWERLRRAINDNSGVEEITIYPKGSDVPGGEDIPNGIFIISDDLTDNTHYINSTGVPINIARDITLKAADGAIILYTRDAGDGRHFNVIGDSEFEWIGVTIDGGEVAGGISIMETGDLTLRGVKIQNCAAVDGGGIFINGGTLTMISGEISHNKADNGGGVMLDEGFFDMQGGSITRNEALYNGGGVGFFKENDPLQDKLLRFSMNGGEISHNQAANGGGVSVVDEFSRYSNQNTNYIRFGMYSGEISRNHAENGGGIYFLKHNAYATTFIGGKISRNTATGNGGGVYSDRSIEIHLDSNLEISSNEAANGGGIYSLSSITANGGGFVDNKANKGGGIYADGVNIGVIGDSGGIVTPINSSAIIKENTAGESGGGVYAQNLFALNGGEITGNRVVAEETGSGGGVYAGSVFRFGSSGTISHNTVSGHDAFGGGVYIGGSITLNIELLPMTGLINIEGTISGNVVQGTNSSRGGGVYLPNGGSLRISGATITDNGKDDNGIVKTKNGGGIWTSGAIWVGNSSIISGNSSGGDGGGIWASGDMWIAGNSAITGNSSGGNGGGVYQNNALRLLRVDNSTVSGNQATVRGGGIDTTSGSVGITNSKIIGNWTSASISVGGGLFASNAAAVLNISDTEINHNGKNPGGTATTTDGGGIWAAGKVAISGGEVKNNAATEQGGGIFIRQHSPLTINQAAFEGNMADAGYASWLEEEAPEYIYYPRDKTDASATAYSITPSGIMEQYTSGQVKELSISASPAGTKAFAYLHNNYDINFIGVEYTVMFDTNGGNPNTLSPLKGLKWIDILSLPEPPRKAGHVFLGWEITDNGKTDALIAPNDMHTYGDLADDPNLIDITLTAKWKQGELRFNFAPDSLDFGRRLFHFNLPEQVFRVDGEDASTDPKNVRFEIFNNMHEPWYMTVESEEFSTEKGSVLERLLYVGGNSIEGAAATVFEDDGKEENVSFTWYDLMVADRDVRVKINPWTEIKRNETYKAVLTWTIIQAP